MNKPYYADEHVTLLLGDCRELLPTLDIKPDSAVCDPPYGETSAAWDRWPDGWVAAVGAVVPDTASLWCFGSARMFLDHVNEFTQWRYAQEALWVKRNGTGPASRDRLVKIHEWAYHWYRGRWSDLHHEWERDKYFGSSEGTKQRITPSSPQRNGYENQAWTDDGTRQPRSVTFVIEAGSVRYQKRHQDEKPLSAVIPLVRECTPPGGLVLDCFAGSGTTGVAAKTIGRRALLIEADEATCETAALRLNDRQGSLLDIIDGEAS